MNTQQTQQTQQAPIEKCPPKDSECIHRAIIKEIESLKDVNVKDIPVGIHNYIQYKSGSIILAILSTLNGILFPVKQGLEVSSQLPKLGQSRDQQIQSLKSILQKPEVKKDLNELFTVVSASLDAVNTRYDTIMKQQGNKLNTAVTESMDRMISSILKGLIRGVINSLSAIPGAGAVPALLSAAGNGVEAGSNVIQSIAQLSAVLSGTLQQVFDPTLLKQLNTTLDKTSTTFNTIKGNINRIENIPDRVAEKGLQQANCVAGRCDDDDDDNNDKQTNS